MTTNTSQNLRRKSKVIMQRWEERARKEVTSAFGTSSLLLQDALQGHLDQLAVALDSSAEKSTAEIAITTTHGEGIGKEHGRDRANTAGYSVEELIFEYRILRQTIIRVLEEDAPLSGVEREIITDLIEQAVNDAAVEFSETLRDLREQYTATLTHDLRGPITVIKGSAELIVRHVDKRDDCLINATRIVESANRMDAMIQNLLDAGRIKAGQPLSVKLVECAPDAIAREVLDEMRTLYGERFSLSAEAELRAWWDLDLFRRALENLLGNAVKYGDTKGRVSVSIQQVDSFIRISVHNEGNPISERDRTALFQKYRRLDSAVNSFKKGWGLGLTLVSGVVQAHGGRVETESSKDSGTTFTMVLPKDCRK